MWKRVALEWILNSTRNRFLWTLSAETQDNLRSAQDFWAANQAKATLLGAFECQEDGKEPTACEPSLLAPAISHCWH